MAEENVNNEEVQDQEVNNEPTTAEEPENNPEETQEDKLFTQADVDKMIQDRLARADKKKDQAVQKEKEEAERKKLEEQEEYKALADTYKQELDALKSEALGTKKDALLTKAGYNDDQIPLLRGVVTGESDEDITNSIEQLKTAFPTKPVYADPSPMNGAKDRPETKDASEIGTSAWERVKNRFN